MVFARSRLFLGILVLAAAFSLPAASEQPLGSAARPHKNKGPLGEWVTNGLWNAKASNVRPVDMMEAYMGLAFNERMTESVQATQFRRIESTVFKKEFKVVLFELEVKNLTDRQQKMGYSIPSWRLRVSDGRDFGVASSTIQYLQSNFPSNTRLNSKATARGTIAFAIPAASQPKVLFFTSTFKTNYGPNESLVLLMAPQ